MGDLGADALKPLVKAEVEELDRATEQSKGMREEPKSLTKEETETELGADLEAAIEHTVPTIHECILKALADQRAEISKLQNKLRRRAACDEAQVDDAEQRACQAQFDLVEFEEEAHEAAEAIEILGHDLQTALDGEAQARDEADEAKGQLEEIWKAVQEGGIALVGKRKADGGLDGHAAKKSKAEPEAE